MTNQQRTWKALAMMFGAETWVKRWGEANDEWAQALNPLPYTAITAAIAKVRNSGLKFYEVDLPTFLSLAKPSISIPATLPLPNPVPLNWQRYTQRQQTFLRQGNLCLWKWMMEATDRTVERLRSDPACLASVLNAKDQIALDFAEMEAELGQGEVTAKDLHEALSRRWNGLTN